MARAILSPKHGIHIPKGLRSWYQTHEPLRSGNEPRGQIGAWLRAKFFSSIVGREAHRMPKRSKTDGLGPSVLRDWLLLHQDEMAGLLAELVAIPTENPPGTKLQPCVDLLEARLGEAGLACKRIQNERHTGTRLNAAPGALDSDEDAGDLPASLLAMYGSGERALYFHGHYDVVPAQSPEQFKPVRKEHFLFGRGSCDMKGGIVAMLYAIRALQECRVELRGRIGLTLVPDEETGGTRGSAWLAQRRLLGPDGIGMLTAEPTSGVVWNANRGAITLRVEVFGKSAHVGLQHQGENAFEHMHRVVEQLLGLKREVERRRTSCNVGAEQARNSILMLGGQSAGGANFNVVPDKCWFTIDRRINPEEDLDAEKTRLLDLLEKCKREGLSLEWEILQEGPSASSREDAALAQALSRSVEAVTGQPPRFEMCPGLLETRFYAVEGMPAYGYGPGLLSVAHGPKEYVDLRRVTDCAAIYALTAMEMLQE
jgi:succinyl-diaminopimelate desuccinylase